MTTRRRKLQLDLFGTVQQRRRRESADVYAAVLHLRRRKLRVFSCGGGGTW